MSLLSSAERDAIMAKDVSGRRLPGCVATPPPHVTRYRGADHVRCSHPTPIAEGFHACEGDSGCQIRLRRRRFCPYHEDLIYDLDPHQLYEELTGRSSARLQARAPWSRQ